MQASAIIPFTTSGTGNFTLAHNLGIVPTTVIFEFTDNVGTVYFQNPRFDTTNLYLVSTASGVTGVAIVFASCSSC